MRAHDAAVSLSTMLDRGTSVARNAGGARGVLLTAVLVLLVVSACTRGGAQNRAVDSASSEAASQAEKRSEAATPANDGDWLDGWMRAWLRASNIARAEQPHFTAPLVTTHVMLVQQYRYDISSQQDSPGHSTTFNYGASRGLEIIPATRLRLGFRLPTISCTAPARKMAPEI